MLACLPKGVALRLGPLLACFFGGYLGGGLDGSLCLLKLGRPDTATVDLSLNLSESTWRARLSGYLWESGSNPESESNFESESKVGESDSRLLSESMLGVRIKPRCPIVRITSGVRIKRVCPNRLRRPVVRINPPSPDQSVLKHFWPDAIVLACPVVRIKT